MADKKFEVGYQGTNRLLSMQNDVEGTLEDDLDVGDEVYGDEDVGSRLETSVGLAHPHLREILQHFITPIPKSGTSEFKYFNYGINRLPSRRINRPPLLCFWFLETRIKYRYHLFTPKRCAGLDVR